MAAFPRLKSLAVAQYPMVRELRHESESVRFLDGSEQRYRKSAPQKIWVIRLSLLDEREMNAVDEFFAANQGAYGDFTFIDPSDGMEHGNCSLEQEAIEFEMNGEMRGETLLVVRQNR